MRRPSVWPSTGQRPPLSIGFGHLCVSNKSSHSLASLELTQKRKNFLNLSNVGELFLKQCSNRGIN